MKDCDTNLRKGPMPKVQEPIGYTMGVAGYPGGTTSGPGEYAPLRYKGDSFAEKYS
jgi:hypothetical protein